MENHPLLKELYKVCSTHNVDEIQALMTFQSFLELSSGRKFTSLEHGFNEKLKLFYLVGKNCNSAQEPEIFVPFCLNDELSPEDMDKLIENINPDFKKLHLIIRDRDSSSTCYRITKGLVKPDCPSETKQNKEKEYQAHQIEQLIQRNRKKLYMTALNKSRPLLL